MDSIRSSRGAVSLLAAFALFAAAAGVLLGDGPLKTIFDLGDGYAWLGTTEDGDLTLVDGRTGEGVTRLDLDENGQKLTVEHREGVAYVVAGGKTLYRLDNADLASGGSVAAIAKGQRIVRGGDNAYLVHERNGTVQAIDPMSLDKQGRRLKYDKPIRAEADPSGRLVVLELDRGRVFVVEGGDSGSAVDVDGAKYLVDAGGVPTAVDLAGSNAFAFRGGKPARVEMGSLPSGNRAGILVPTRSEDDRVGLLVPNRNVAKLVVTDLKSAETRANEFRMSAEETKGLEAPFVAKRAVYLVNKSEGRVLVIDPKTLELRKELPSLGEVGASKNLEVFLKDGRLWVNNPDGDKALIVDHDGSSRNVTKKSPQMPVVSPATDEAPVEPAPGPSDSPGQNNSPAPGNSPGANSAGPGAASGAGPGPGAGAPPVASPGGPVSPPDRPNLSGVPGNREARLSWSANGTGGSAITGWTLTWSDGNGKDVTRTYGPGDTGAVIDGLRNGTTYEFELRARNDATDPSPAARAEVRPTSKVPERPAGVQAASTADGALEVSWEEADGNGIEVKSYEVWARSVDAAQPSGPATTTRGTTRATLAGGSFAAGTNVEIWVTATSVGTSDPSDSVFLRVSTRPGQPALTYTPHLLAFTATVNCDAACRGSKDEVGYRIWTDPPTREHRGRIDAGGVATEQFDGLTERTTYQIWTEVDNGLGTSTAEQSYTAPGRPVVGTVVGVTPQYDRTVSVSVPVDAGGLQTTCNFSGNGRSTGPGGCSGRALNLGGNFNTVYAVTVVVQNDLATATGSGNVRTGPKRLFADGDHWGCPNPPTNPSYCGPTVSRLASRAWTTDRTTVAKNTVIYASCQTTGSSITDPANGASTTLWVRSHFADAHPWMSAHYFGTTDFGGVVAGLPPC